jgi:hypothetical protein
VELKRVKSRPLSCFEILCQKWKTGEVGEILTLRISSWGSIEISLPALADLSAPGGFNRSVLGFVPLMIFKSST